jgi:hypothetical protein
MNIENYLGQYSIKKSEFGEMLGYTTKQGIYTALKNKKQRPLLYAFLLKVLLEGKGVNLERLLDSVSNKGNDLRWIKSIK